MSEAVLLRSALQDAAGRLGRILHALDAGDVDLARLVAETAENDLSRALGGRPAICPHCTLTFRWPGELQEHVDRAHPEDEEPW